MTLRCSGCHRAVPEAEIVKWKWPPEWFSHGEKGAAALARVGKPTRPKVRVYHLAKGRRMMPLGKSEWREWLCGELRESSEQEDYVDWLGGGR
jgi:hypothetical protein